MGVTAALWSSPRRQSLESFRTGRGQDVPQLVKVDTPVLSLGLLTFGQVRRRVEGDVDGATAVEDDGSGVLVEEGLDADDLVSRVEEGEQGSVHS